MSYVFQNIFTCLLLAGIVGGVIGWILHRLLSGNRISEIENEWKSRLDGERSKWTASLGEQEGLVAQWKTRFSGLEGDFGKLKADLGTAQARIPALEADLKTCGEARKALELQLGTWTEKAKAWDGERATMVANASKLTADLGQIPVLETAVAGWVAKSALWDGERGKFDGDLKAANTKIAALTGSDEAQRKEIAALKSRVANLEFDLNAAQKFSETQKADYEKAVAADRADDAGYEKRIAELEGQLKAAANAAETKSSSLQKELAAAAAGAVAALAAKSAIDVDLQASKAEAESLRAQLKKAIADDMADDAAFRKEITELRAQNNKLEFELKSMTKSSAQLKADLDKAIADDRADDSAYQKRIKALEADLAIATAETKRVNDLAKADVASLEEQIADLKGRLTIMLEESTGAQDKLSEMTALMASKSSEEQAASGEVSALRAQVDVLREQLATASAEAKRVNDLARADNATYAEQVKDLQGRLAAMQEESAGAQNKLSDLSALMAAKASAEDAATGEVAALRAQVDVLREQLSTASAEAKRVNDLARADIRTYEEQLVDLKARLAAMQESSTVAQGKIVELEGMHSRASLEAETRAGEIGALRAQLDTTREKLIALEASAAQPAPAVAMAAAAGFAGGSQASMPPVPSAAPAEADDRYEKLKARFDGFVIAQQREGYGDIERIEGIGPVFGQKLRATGIAWVKTLLEEGATPAGRKAIVAETGLDPRSVLDWVNAADLLRIEGMTPDWAELLEKSGVDTVKELRNRVPENLQKKMEATNPTGPRGRFSPTVPDVETVKRFIEIAKTLEPKVSH